MGNTPHRINRARIGSHNIRRFSRLIRFGGFLGRRSRARGALCFRHSTSQRVGRPRSRGRISCCFTRRCSSRRRAIPRCSRSCRRSGARSAFPTSGSRSPTPGRRSCGSRSRPIWAEKSDHHGRKALTLLGLTGFIVSTLLCGTVLHFGLEGAIGGGLTFILFGIFRAIYGALGSATPSATQAYLAAKTRRSGRVAALSALSSSFGLGTIIGPAVAPLFVLPFVGLAGPLFAFSLIAVAGLHRHPAVASERPLCAGGSGAARR